MDEKLPDELVIYRLNSIENRLEQLSGNIDRLAQVIITRESFNELATDVRDYVRQVDKLEARVKNLERLAQIATGIIGAAAATIVAKILDLI